MKISRWERLALWAAAVALCFGGGWLARDLWGGRPMEVRVQVQGADEAGSGVELVDTVCAALELTRIYRPSRLRERLWVRPLAPLPA